MQEKIAYLSLLFFFIASYMWHLIKMWQIDNQKNHTSDKLKQKDSEIEYYMYLSLQQQKSCARSINRFENPPPAPKKKQKFKEVKTINRNIKDPTTGDRLEIVICHCGTTHSEASYDLYGCDCEIKIINPK